MTVWTLASAIPLASRASAQQNHRDVADKSFVYIFGPTGTFLKLNVDNAGIEAYWMLYRTNGSLSVLPRCREGAVVDAGCNLIWDRLQLARNSGQLYGVFPTKNSQTQSEDSIEYQVAFFQLPELNLAGSLPIPQAQPEPPGLLVTPDGRQLWVSFRDPEAEARIAEPTIVSILEVYDAATLKVLFTKRESASIKDITTLKATLNTSFTNKAYFSPDGKAIFDGLYSTSITGSALKRIYVNPLEKLSPQQRDQLKEFQKVDPATQRPWLDFAAGDSAAGKTVIRIANSSFTQAAYWVVDLQTGNDSPIIIAPFGVAHLTPDGQTMLLQTATVEKQANGGSTVKAAANFRLYEVANGRAIGQFGDKALEGPPWASQLLCISPSGKRAFFGIQQKIEVISLPDGQRVREVEARTLQAPMASCVFADR